MEQHEIEHGAERVLRPRVGDRVLDGLADRDAERTGVSRVLGEDLLAVLRVPRRAGHDRRAVRLHQDPAVRLLVVARPDHEHLAELRGLEPEEGQFDPAAGAARHAAECEDHQDQSHHSGSRDVTEGVTGGVGTEVGGTRNYRQGTGVTGGDIGNRPE